MEKLPDFGSKDFCRLMIDELTGILAKLELDASFLVYGSYYGKWHDGTSDLDGIIYFRDLPFRTQNIHKMRSFQSEVRQIYQKYGPLKDTAFFKDIFILDSFHGSDGRFMIFDKGFIDRMVIGANKKNKIHTETPTKYSTICGRNFLQDLKAVNLRQQDEFELAIGLARLRNYFLFELTKRVADINKAACMLKFFKVLPRNISIILGEPLAGTPEELLSLKGYNFKKIDLSPLIHLWGETDRPELLEAYLNNWHRLEDNSFFLDCLLCYEELLKELVNSIPKLSKN